MGGVVDWSGCGGVVGGGYCYHGSTAVTMATLLSSVLSHANKSSFSAEMSGRNVESGRGVGL